MGSGDPIGGKVETVLMYKSTVEQALKRLKVSP